MPRELYRIVRGPFPSLEDFRSAKALGKPLINDSLEREWSAAISVYDDLDRAIDRAQAARFRVGTYVARLALPEDGRIDVQQTTADPHHYHLYAEPDALLELVIGRSLAIMRRRP